jgi:hypothetical protein
MLLDLQAIVQASARADCTRVATLAALVSHTPTILMGVAILDFLGEVPFIA